MSVILQINDSGTIVNLELQDNRVQLVGPVINTLPAPTSITIASGPAGPQGIAGLSLRNGAGAPSSGLGSNGDFYINTSANTIYGPKTSGSWGSPTSIIGATGPANSLSVGTITTGAAGSSASATITGTAPTQTLNLTIPRGNTGVAGADGRTILSGSGVPSSGTGANGDFYIDTTNNKIHGPKASGTWPSGVNLIGATGSTGPAGSDATLDGQGDTGWHPGDFSLLAWTGDPMFYTSTFALTVAGKAYLAAVKIRRNMSVTNIVTSIQTVGAGLTSGNCRAALWNSAGTLIGQTADQSGTWVSTGRKDMSLTGGPFNITSGLYYIGVWYNGTTGPTFLRAVGSNQTNILLSSSTPIRAGDGNTGLTTTAGTLTVGAASGNFLWMGLS